MEVLEAKKWRMETTCTTCGSKLALSAEDVRFWSNQRTGNEGYDYICPECADRPDLDEEKLPSIVKKNAVERWRIRVH